LCEAVRPADGELQINLKLRHFGLLGSTILVCIVGFAASLLPAIEYTDPFWGVRGFMDKELFDLGDAPGVIVTQIHSGSPAASAGLRERDRILAVNGVQAEFGTFEQLLDAIQPGQQVTLEVKRSGQDLRLVANGEIPTLEAVLFLDWQFVSAPVFLVLLLVLVATQPLHPPPLWRALLVILGGLAVITVTVIVETTEWIPWTAVWRSKSVSHGVAPALHYPLTAAVLLSGLALTILGALAVRAVLVRRAIEPASPIPLDESQ